MVPQSKDEPFVAPLELQPNSEFQIDLVFLNIAHAPGWLPKQLINPSRKKVALVQALVIFIV